MNTTSVSRPEVSSTVRAPGRVLVWDLPVRVFHVLLALCLAGAWLSAESERWRLLHVTLGYTMAGLVTFRLAWGVLGTRYARFTDFVRGPAAVRRYVRAALTGVPEHHLGHNPVGALAIVAMLALVVLMAFTGVAASNDFGGEALAELHELVADALLALVAIHVTGVLIASVMHRENLLRAMVDGRKAATPADAVPDRRAGVAVLLILAVLAFWGWQWHVANTIDAVWAVSGAAPTRH